MSFSHPWQEADFEQLFTTPGIFADGAIEAKQQQLAGFILSRVAGGEAEILTLAVAPEWRRLGVATSLLKPHLQGLVEARVTRLFLEVSAENVAALALYKKLGFEQVGERKAYYRAANNELTAALIMRRDLIC